MAPQKSGHGAAAQRQDPAKKQKTGHHSEPKASKQSGEQKSHRAPAVAPTATVASTPAAVASKPAFVAPSPAIASTPAAVASKQASVAPSPAITSTPAVALANLLVDSQTPAVRIAPEVAKQKGELPTTTSHGFQTSHEFETSLRGAANIARVTDVVKVKFALSGQKYFPDVPVKVRDMVANIANECLSLEHSARHPFQHKMMEAVDAAVVSAKTKLEAEVQERKTFVETAQQKKEALLRTQTEQQQELEKKQIELAKSVEERGSAAERLQTAQEAAKLACTATFTAQRSRDACEQECMKIKQAYESFATLDDEGTGTTNQADVVIKLLPTLKILGVDSTTMDTLPSVVAKPGGERSSGESMSLILIEGMFAKRIRDDNASLSKSEMELKQKETTEATAKEDVQKRADEFTACGEVVKTKEAEQKDQEQRVSAATLEVKRHESEMNSGESKLQSQQADLDAFMEIHTKYLVLKNPTPPPSPEPAETPQPAPAAGA